MRNSLNIVVIFSILILLIPASNSFAEEKSNEEKTFEEYKEIQKLEAQKLRDYYFEVIQLKNPYNNELLEDKVILITTEFSMPKKLSRNDENFKMFKSEQADFAQNKLLEIVGGNIINSLDDESDKRIFPILQFTDEEEKIRKAIHRDEDGFKSYKIKQLIIAENTVNKLIQEGIWPKDPFITSDLFENKYNKNSVKDKESVRAALDLIDDGIVTTEELIKNNKISSKDLIQDNIISANNLKLFWQAHKPDVSIKTEIQETLPKETDLDWKNIEWKKTSRLSPEFQNLLAEQVLLAENKRSEVFSYFPHLNPYEKQSYNETNNELVITQMFVELEPIIKRDDKKFQEYKLEQIKNAELLFKNLYNLKNLDENETNNELIIEEITLQQTSDRNNRNDISFFKLKEFENDKAKQKILELFGGKNIYN